jgi:hypothetical protein
LDSVTWCFLNSIILSILHRTMAYASSVHNNLDSLSLKFWFSF